MKKSPQKKLTPSKSDSLLQRRNNNIQLIPPIPPQQVYLHSPALYSGQPLYPPVYNAPVDYRSAVSLVPMPAHPVAFYPTPALPSYNVWSPAVAETSDNPVNGNSSAGATSGGYIKRNKIPLPIVPPPRERRPLEIIDPKVQSLVDFSNSFSLALPLNSDQNKYRSDDPRELQYHQSGAGLQLPLVRAADLQTDYQAATSNQENMFTVSPRNSISIPEPALYDIESVISTSNSETPVSNELDGFLEKMKSLLKKLTPRTFDEISEHFLALEEEMVRLSKTADVIDLIFGKVTNEPRYCEMCAVLCEMMTQKQSTINISSENSPNRCRSNNSNKNDSSENVLIPDKNRTSLEIVGREKADSFRYQLLNKCKAVFELNKSSESFKELRMQEIDKEKDEEKQNLLKRQLDDILCKRKRHILESIRFIGELCQRKLVSKFIAHFSIQHLLTKTSEFESLKCLCLFLRTVGKTLEEDKMSKDNLAAYFEQLKKILQNADKRKLPQRIRQEIMNVISLRKKDWMPDNDEVGNEVNFRTFECVVCFEEVGHQKFLDCGENSARKHALCEKCVRKLSTNVSWSAKDKIVECPVCRSNTLLSDGNPAKLPTKFFVDLLCEDCSTSKPIDDLIWCKICQVTICRIRRDEILVDF